MLGLELVLERKGRERAEPKEHVRMEVGLSASFLLLPPSCDRSYRDAWGTLSVSIWTGDATHTHALCFGRDNRGIGMVVTPPQPRPQ